MSRHENPGERILRSSLADHAAQMKRRREEDPTAHAAYLEQERQKALKLAGRNPDGSRK